MGVKQRPFSSWKWDLLNTLLDHTGCQWKDLPQDYPGYDSVYYYYGKWREDGTRRRVNEVLRQRGGQGREPALGGGAHSGLVQPLPKVERWSKDYERRGESSESMIYIASIHTLMRRLAPCP